MATQTITSIAKRNNQKAAIALRGMIDQWGPQFGRALPKGHALDRFKRALETSINSNPALLQADARSLVGAAMMAAQLGLEPGPMQQCALVPFKGKVEFVPMYRGLIDLARRSGEIKQIHAEVVRLGDTFEVEHGLDEKFRHVPDWTGDHDRPAICVYAYAHLTNGGFQGTVIPWPDIEALKAERLKAKKNPSASPWHKHTYEMAKKTAIKRLFKTLPMGIELADLRAQLEHTDEATATARIEAGQAVVDVTPAHAEVVDVTPDPDPEPEPEPPKPAKRKATKKAKPEPQADQEPEQTKLAPSKDVDPENVELDGFASRSKPCAAWVDQLTALAGPETAAAVIFGSIKHEYGGAISDQDVEAEIAFLTDEFDDDDERRAAIEAKAAGYARR